ncbi:phage antirepressor KilAC domain-containing protein [Paenibacillus sp. FSL K6-1230]|uniref:phage antirepressor KilAC domain-containing protein n=1 Tax=Paenibacillus sp. FSL K6-1230 TaxID=2921603 RepID=UPI0030F5D716
MSKGMIVFENQHEVTILTREDVGIDFKGDFLISAKDIAVILEYQGEKATNNVLKFCKESHIFRVKNSDILNRNVRKMNNAGEAFVTSFALNRVLGQSSQPKAEAFQDWLYEDILPSIQKHGVYATDNVIDNILNNPDFGIELLTKLKEERAARVQAERTNAILMHVNKTYTATEIAKELGFKSAIALNNDLGNRKIQFRQNDTWLLYSKYADCGYVEIKQEVLDNGKVIYHRRFTQLGRKWLLKTYGGE